jgi:TetR/AcrR family transcriptional regulator
MTDKPSRKDQILEALATMLEAEPGARITTAGLARQVGVSEAALYRHFPSKTRMFEGLIGYADEAVFTRINQIQASTEGALEQAGQILTLVLLFAERNPGIARLLIGDALAGENERLHRQIEQFFSRVESQLKQLLRQAEFKQGLRTRISPALTANLLMACVEGHIVQFVRSGFSQKPSAGWQEQWGQLQGIVFA